MNILFLLGNGFDINLKLPTDYQSFYDTYLKQASTSVPVTELKKHLVNERYETWADLELGLGQYTAKIKSVEELETIYYDLSDHLREYLQSISKKFETTSACNSAIIWGLSYPHIFLSEGMNRELSSYLGSKPRDINVITFNYTDIFERIVGFGYESLNYPILVNTNASLRSTRHIHMSLADSDFIMGVNDDSQIQNHDLLNDACRNLMVKPHINQQLQNLVDEECLELINQADLICLFGLSLGKTDLMWWKALGDRMTSSATRLIYFVHDKVKLTRNNEIIRRMQESRSLLVERFCLEKTPTNLMKRIYIGYNTNMFEVVE